MMVNSCYMYVDINFSVFSVQVLQHLLELGADISLRTRHGWTGVHICAIRGCTVCLRVCKVAAMSVKELTLSCDHLSTGA